jgi:hypothetical protein
VDFLPPELTRLLGALDGVSDRRGDIFERLAAGVDPQGAPADRHPFPGLSRILQTARRERITPRMMRVQ